MRAEEAIREALQQEGARHRVNPALPGSTILKARVARAAMVVGAAGVVAALAVGGATAVGAINDERPGLRAAAGPSETPRPARQTRGVPLLLVEHPGWRVVRADQYEWDEGEVTFSDGEHELELTWRPAATHDGYVHDRAADAGESWDLDIAGRHGKLFRYDRTTDFTTLWTDGDLSLELRGVFDDVDAYRAVAETLARVDEETWLAALPDDTVAPDERAAAVDEMLRDMPVHPDVSVAELEEGRAVNDRYQLGARVSGAVACAWIRQWIDATAAGDEAAAREAVHAMSSARDWAILEEMRPQGGWPDVLWEYADAMRGDGTVDGGADDMSIESTYRNALACPR
jgi:hypothetical protein